MKIATLISMMSYVWVGLGSAIGGMARFGVSTWVDQRIGQTFPYGIMIVNITGCLIMGVFEAFSITEGKTYLSPDVRQFLMIGIMGGYTTFSSFSLQTLNLVRSGEWLYAAGNVAISIVACLFAVWVGFTAGTWFQK